MNYLTFEPNLVIWTCFVAYLLAALFLLPSKVNFKFDNFEPSNQQALTFASRFVLRIALLFPMLLVLKNVA